MRCVIYGTPINVGSLSGGELCYVQDYKGTFLALVSEKRARDEQFAIFLAPVRGYESAPGDRYLSGLRSKRVFKLKEDGIAIVPDLLSAEISQESFGTEPGTIVQVDDALFLAFQIDSDVAYLKIENGQIYRRPPDGERTYFGKWAIECERNGELVKLASFPYDQGEQDSSVDG